MEKIKSVLHGHKKSEDVPRDSTTSASGTTSEGQQHPIYDEMHHGHSVAPGKPHYEIKTTSGEPYTVLAQPGSSATHGHSEYTGTEQRASHPTATTGHHDNHQSTNQTHAKDGGNASIVPQKLQEKLPESVERAVPNAIHDTGDRKHDYDSTNRPHDSTNTVAGGIQRPDVNPTGGVQHTEMSTASIKSGVIGFGPGERQGHAALSTHNPTDQYLDRDQVVGGGHPGSAGMSEGQGLQPNSGPHSTSQSASIGHEQSGTNLGSVKESQPYESTLRQESYTADTNRSFPLAGGITSQHRDVPASSTRPETENVPSSLHSAEPTSTLHQNTVSEHDLGSKESNIASPDSHGREALAGAAVAATAVGASQSRSHPEERNVHDQSHMTATHQTTHSQPTGDEGILAKGKRLLGLGTTKEHTDSDNLGTHRDTYGDVPAATSQTGSGTTRSTEDHHPEALAAATAAAATAASKSSHSSSSTQGLRTQDHNLSDTTQIANTSTPITGGFAGERPQGQRMESYPRHIPGAFIATPSEHRNTFLDYTSVVEPTHTSAVGLTSTSNTSALDSQPTTFDSLAGQPSTEDPLSSTGQHELRHTGTLHEPQPRSSIEHHHGRDSAALAGGIGAGAGLGYAASQRHETPDVGSSKPLYEETSPYSSKTLDPRVLGTKANLEKQRLDPQAKSEVSPHHAAQTSNPAGISTGTSAAHDPTKTDDSQHRYGRNAALVGAGTATGAGLPHSLHRNDTPGTGTAIPTQESSYSSVPASTVPQQSANTSALLSSSTTSNPQQRSTGNDTFYGTAGAPAPVADHNTHQQPQSGLRHSSTSESVRQREKESEHHYGRNAGLAGAGAAGAGALYAANRDDKTHTGPSSSSTPASSTGLASDTAPTYGTGLISASGPATGLGQTSATGPTSNTGLSNAGPASNTIGPHSSNIANVLDPRVQPDPAQQKSHSTTGPHQSDILNRMDPKVSEKAGQQSEHNYSRDAVGLGAAGAAGYGAHEAAQAYGDHRMTQPAASMIEQRYDSTARGAQAPSPVDAKSEYNYNDPSIQSNVNRTNPNTESHTGRNATLGGAGLAAAGLGAGAYAHSKNDNNTQQLPLHQRQEVASSTLPGSMAQSSYPATSTHPTSSSYPTQGTAQSSYPTTSAHPTSTGYPTQGMAQTAYPTQGTNPSHSTQLHDPASQQPYGATRDPSDQSHDKRNAALLGAGGAAAVGGGAYALSQQQDERERARLAEREQERLKKEAHDREKEQHKLDKEQHKHDKEVYKHDQAVAAHEKDQAHLQKEQDKEQHRLAKEQHAREKEAEKEARRHEKETEGEEKKKGGLLGFLHRDKSKKEKSANSPDSSPRQSGERTRHSRDSPRHSKEYAAGALGAGTTAAAYDDDHPDSSRWKGKNLLHKDPPMGHPARETLEHPHEGEFTGKREHVGVDGPIGDPNVISGDRETHKSVYGAHPVDDLGRDNTVTEPHTGLPMNVGRYGTGTGGTDGNATIHGHHTHGAPAQGATGADYEAIKKANTPY